MCKCPEARAWALPYMASARSISSRDLDRGCASSLQLNSLLFVYVWRQMMKINILTKKYYQVPISVVLIGTQPVIITAGRHGVIQTQRQTHKRSTIRLRKNLL